MIRLLILILLVVFFIVPNIVNKREKEHFSDEKRLERAKKEDVGDSIRLRASTYYSQRSDLHNTLFGKKYREIWNTRVKVPVFDMDTLEYTCHEIGGGQQTIAIELKDEKGRIWTLRSVDKDQSGALNDFLNQTIVRKLVRDEAAALNPYGAFVVDDLAEAAGILHTNPSLVYMPYIPELQEACRDRMAGRLSLFEEEIDEEGWPGQGRFSEYSKIMDSEDMLTAVEVDKSLGIDTMAFLKARLFDILIGDWDRHAGNWAWAFENNTFTPIPIDRDMAFHLFDDGVINRFFLNFNNKFTSYHPEYKDVSGFHKNARELDLRILKEVNVEKFVAYADSLQKNINRREVVKAFEEYPSPIFEKIGVQHIETFMARKDKLKMAAKDFFTAINN